MKSLFAILFLAVSIAAYCQEPMEKSVEPSDTTDAIFVVVEEAPQFPGGIDALKKYFSIETSKIAKSLDIEGIVYVSFVITKTGKIADPKVVRGIHKDCDLEAVRLVREMPDWVPGRQGGKAVNVKFILPVKFYK